MKQQKSEQIIMKFSGTAIGSPEAIRRLITIVSSTKDPIGGVVVSAFAKVTDQLIESANLASQGDKGYSRYFVQIADRHTETVHELITEDVLRKQTMHQVESTLDELESVLEGIYLLREISPKVLDKVMSYGELLSAYIISQSFVSRGIAADFIDTRGLIKTDTSFGSARVAIEQTFKNITKSFNGSQKSIRVITGFIGSTEKGETTTFGRKGSDYTATLVGAAIKASKIEFWTDVDGILTADPGKVPTAFTIKHMTYQEAMEMSHFGAKVIYPQMMVPAFTYKIPIVVRNTFNPTFAGTVIGTETEKQFMIKGISSIENIALVMVQGSGMRGTHGMAARLFGALAFEDINIILITQASSEYTICFAIDPKDAKRAKHILTDEFKHELLVGLIDPLVIEEDLSIIAIVGEQMRNTIGAAGKLFTTLGDAKINVTAIAQGSSERNISCVIAKKEVDKAVRAIHKEFFEKK